ncbi:MAG TPA: glutamine synthetase family protein [Vicinamibacteria bacterium]|nr:glutamine synthetase family protein [Vicinamibacteria bacterium]
MSASTGEAVLGELKQRGTRRVKLGIADIDGILRGKYLALDKFASICGGSAGFCDCIFGWDSSDQLYDNAEFSGWHKGFPDVAYRLDLGTMRWLPDEEATPFFLAELVPPAGSAFHPICPRNVLRRVLAAAAERGFEVRLAFEYEFFLFHETPETAREKGYRNLRPFTPGMFGYSVLRTSVNSDLYQEFQDYCEAMDMGLEAFHTETGPGVLEAAIGVSPALAAADKAVLFKTFSKVFFQKHGLLPTFMAKWSLDYPGQGGHVHQSLWDAKSGQPVFHAADGRFGMSGLMERYVAGQLQHMRELTALVAPTVNSYTRLVKGAWAPTTATWALDNRTTAIRVVPGGEKAQRVEYRLAASDAHPYLVVAANIASGLEGIDRKLALPAPVTGNAYEAQASLPEERQLPCTLREAAAAFRKSEMARRWLGDEFVEHFAASRDWETRQFERAVTDWELARYFEII